MRVRRSARVAAAPEAVWELIVDPRRLPRWWPGVERIEGVDEGRATFTQVLVSKRGRPVRADFRVPLLEAPRRVVWEQELAGTPFERVLSSSVTDLSLDGAGAQTVVTIERRQRLRGLSHAGGWMLRRATRRQLDGALEGLGALFGDGGRPSG